MRQERSIVWAMCICLIAVTALQEATPSYGQQRRSIAERRQRPGQGFWANQRASRNLRHARDYSQSLYRYSLGVEIMQPDVARSESEELGAKLEATKKELAAIRKEVGDDNEVQAALQAIEDHLTKATAKHKELHAECCKEKVDGAVCAICTNDIIKELEKAMAEHAALQRHLELKAQGREKDEK